jgi:hypothetical protein
MKAQERDRFLRAINALEDLIQLLPPSLKKLSSKVIKLLEKEFKKREYEEFTFD